MAKKAGGYGTCRHCKSMVLESPVQLTGEYTTVLCVDCINEWHEHIRDHPDRVALIATETRMNVLYAQIKHDGVDRSFDIDEQNDQYRAQKNKLYDLARDWVEAAIPE